MRIGRLAGALALCAAAFGCEDLGRVPAPTAPAPSPGSAPQVSRVFPASTVAGDTVWVEGARFGDGSDGVLRVDTAGTSEAATVLAWTDSFVVARVPALSGPVSLVVSVGATESPPAPFDIDAVARSYTADVEPIFRNQQYGCWSCHSGFGSAGLNVVPWADLLSGESDHGPVITPRFGEESVLVKKLRGTAGFGEQMPFGGTPLADGVIEVIVEWINQGARNN